MALSRGGRPPADGTVKTVNNARRATAQRGEMRMTGRRLCGRAQIGALWCALPTRRRCLGSGSGGVEEAADEEADRGGAEPDRNHLQAVLAPVSDEGH